MAPRGFKHRPQKPRARTGSKKGPETGRRLLVLVVDDARDTREMYARYLRHKGMRTAMARHGAEAFAKAVRLRPDVVVMDMSMPVLAGDYATMLLKTDPRTARIPVIGITAFGSFMEQRAAEARCDLLYSKPYLPHDLAQAIERLATESGPA